MNCIGFPKMFKANSTVVIDNSLEATRECVKLLLGSEQGELFGDPQFGVRIKRYTFNQNNYVLRDVLIDELYSKICLFCPQIQVSRDNISVEQSDNKLVVHLELQNKATFITSTLDLVLFNEEEE